MKGTAFGEDWDRLGREHRAFNKIEPHHSDQRRDGSDQFRNWDFMYVMYVFFLSLYFIYLRDEMKDDEWQEDKAELAHSYVVRKMELKTVFSPLLFKT
jgi:hypothetical protein